MDIVPRHRPLWLMAAGFLCLLLLAGLACSASAQGAETVRVGLFYGSGALPTANLANEVGSGYEFGTFSSDGQFTAVGDTEEEKITVCKDANLYLSGKTYYETPLASGYTLVGAYHLQLGTVYGSYEEALEASQAYPYGFPAYVNGSYVVRFEFYSTAGNAQADAAQYPGTVVTGASATCYTVTQTSTGRILFEFDMGKDTCLGIQPRGNGQEARTWFKGYQYYGGFQYQRRSGNDLTVVNFVDEDRYVAGVLPNEFVCSGGMESLKAGCVAIRTFARRTQKHSALGFDVCSTTNCQVYRGVYTGSNSDKVLLAAQQTQGQCLYYGGKLIEALYFAADGGATESAVNAWGQEYPYLQGKEDPYESTVSFGARAWSYTITPEQVASMLRSRGYTCGKVVAMEVTETTPSGNVNALTITDDTGKKIVFTQDNVRCLQTISGVQYMSRRFTVTPASQAGQTTKEEEKLVPIREIAGTAHSGQSGNLQGVSGVLNQDGLFARVRTQVTVPASTGGTGWVVSGGGYGHNVGMSQWGAYAMAALGYTYEDILRFYYTGATLQ